MDNFLNFQTTETSFPSDSLFHYGTANANRSLMSMVVESITTEKDRMSARTGRRSKKTLEAAESSSKETKTPDPDWKSLQEEIQEMIDTTLELNKIFRSPKDVKACSSAFKKTVEIFTRREELFTTLHKCAPSHQKRDTLALLHKLKDIDDNDYIGVRIRLFDIKRRLSGSPESLEPKVVKNIHEILEEDHSKDDFPAQNFLLAYGMSFREMAAKKDREKRMIPSSNTSQPKKTFKFARPLPAKPKNSFYSSKTA